MVESTPQYNKKILTELNKLIKEIHLMEKCIREIFGIIENKTVELKGEPSYTSGDQKWKGAQAILNSSVIVINIAANRTAALSS